MEYVKREFEGLQTEVEGEIGDLQETLEHKFGEEGRVARVLDEYLGDDGSLNSLLEAAFDDDGLFSERLDEELGVFDVVFLGEFVEKNCGGDDRSVRKQPDMGDSTGFGIHRTEQTEPLAIDFHNRFTERDLMRLAATSRFQVAFVHQIADGRARSVDAETLQHQSRF